LRLAGVSVQALSEAELLTRMDQAIVRRVGGWVVTANVDILRNAARDPRSRGLIESADLVVADGAPLVWASRLAGRPFPERVTGADLLWTMSETVARRGGSVFVLGGLPGAAEACAAALSAAYPGLGIAGTLCPPFGFDRDPGALAEICATVAAARPTLVLVAMGFPRQEQLIEKLRAVHPTGWYLGCGAAVNFAAGSITRAPEWMQRHGLEWLHRVAREPRRLGSRYLRQGIPFALSLLAGTLARRVLRPESLAGTKAWAELPARPDLVPAPAGIPAAEMLSPEPLPGATQLVDLVRLQPLAELAEVVPIAD
jgi:N-acetylglucosaminyldiphosphoundecaprenol N-acetyl-beta-D-mannosaminyltransferase